MKNKRQVRVYILLVLLFVLVYLLLLSAFVFVIGFVIGCTLKYVSELTGYEEKLYKISMWFFIILAIAAFLLEYIAVRHFGYVRSVKEYIAFPPGMGAGVYYMILMPAAIFLLFTIIRSFFVKYKEYSTIQYTTMSINLQIAVFIFINSIAHIIHQNKP